MNSFSRRGSSPAAAPIGYTRPKRPSFFAPAFSAAAHSASSRPSRCIRPCPILSSAAHSTCMPTSLSAGSAWADPSSPGAAALLGPVELPPPERFEGNFTECSLGSLGRAAGSRMGSAAPAALAESALAVRFPSHHPKIRTACAAQLVVLDHIETPERPQGSLDDRLDGGGDGADTTALSAGAGRAFSADCAPSRWDDLAFP